MQHGGKRMTTTSLERLLTADEALGVLGVSKGRLYQLVRRGLLPSVRLGRQVRFSPKVLERFIETGGKALEAPAGPDGRPAA
jgi:excisionase family DNA binding protein